MESYAATKVHVRVARTAPLLSRAARKLANSGLCTCGHSLSEHTPKADRVFSWPCDVCTCPAYDEGD